MCKRFAAVTVAAGLCLGMLAGCSQDRHVFESTVERPTTVLLTDPYSQRVVWSQDVPVEHRLVVNLDRPGEVAGLRTPDRPATSLRWSLYRQGERLPLQRDTVSLPGTPVVMHLVLRPAPEYPGASPAWGAEPRRGAGQGDATGEPPVPESLNHVEVDE